MVTISAVAQSNEPPDAWDRVLDLFVDERGRVDFVGLAANPEDLNAYVDYIATVNPQSTPDAFPTADAELAYYLNSYNALAMQNILDVGIPSSLANFFRKFSFFYWKRFNVGGKSISLYHYENDVIRALGDERVHFALNCMSVSCPRLPRVSFTADSVQTELDTLRQQFFSEERNIRVDHARHAVEVSEILDFYADDFLANSPSLISYINRYRDNQIPGSYTVEFIDYDWTVNRQ